MPASVSFLSVVGTPVLKPGCPAARSSSGEVGRGTRLGLENVICRPTNGVHPPRVGGASQPVIRPSSFRMAGLHPGALFPPPTTFSASASDKGPDEVRAFSSAFSTGAALRSLLYSLRSWLISFRNDLRPPAHLAHPRLEGQATVLRAAMSITPVVGKTSATMPPEPVRPRATVQAGTGKCRTAHAAMSEC